MAPDMATSDDVSIRAMLQDQDAPWVVPRSRLPTGLAVCSTPVSSDRSVGLNKTQKRLPSRHRSPRLKSKRHATMQTP
jgi:hypothetical protein